MPVKNVRLAISQIEALQQIATGKNKRSKMIVEAMRNWQASGRGPNDIVAVDGPIRMIPVSYNESDAHLFIDKTGIPFSLICRSAVQQFVEESGSPC